MADATDLKSVEETREGSTPSAPTRTIAQDEWNSQLKGDDPLPMGFVYYWEMEDAEQLSWEDMF